jgi:hypothetical protein
VADVCRRQPMVAAVAVTVAVSLPATPQAIDVRRPAPWASVHDSAGVENEAYIFRMDAAPADVEADVRAAAPPGTVAGLDITADATGLTLFATVRRADEPG